MVPRAVRVLTFVIPLAVARVGYTQDAFEIQVYRTDINEPGHVGLELHSIYTAEGRTTYRGTEIPTQHLWHETLEPSLGLTRWWELGAYLQFARAPEQAPVFAGVKVRSKFRIPLNESVPLRLGVNVEVAYVPATFESNVWGAEIRPVLAWHPGHFDFAFNPIFGVDLNGPHAGIPQFEPCLAALYEVANLVGLGVEYYGAFGPVTQWSAWPQQGQYVFAVANVIAWHGWEAQLGAGVGLTDDSNRVAIRTILGHEF